MHGQDKVVPISSLLNILLGSLVNAIRQQIEKNQGEESGEAGFRGYDYITRKQKGINDKPNTHIRTTQ